LNEKVFTKRGRLYESGSTESFRIFGFDPATVKPSSSIFLERIHPKDQTFVQQTIDRAVRERSDLEMG